MKRIIILSTAHEYQDDGHPLNFDFGQRLEYLCKAVTAQVVMEEWTQKDRVSFASKFFAGKAKWENVGTGGESQFRTYRLPLRHPGHSGALEGDPDAPEMWEYGPYIEQESREEAITKNIQNVMTQYEAGILILGLAHLHSMFGRLRQNGFDVGAFYWFRLSSK